MNVKKLLAPLLAGAMVLGLMAPVPAAAATNKVVKVPVNFTNSEYDDEDASRTVIALYGLGEPDTYSADGYTISYKLYVPESFIKEKADIREGSDIELFQAIFFSDASDGKFGGRANAPYACFHSDGSLTDYDDETEQNVAIDYVTAKKSNGYWVFSYEAECGPLITPESVETDISKASSVNIEFDLYIHGVRITAENKAIYLDDLKITKADGTTVVDQNFDSLKDLKGKSDGFIAPDVEVKELTITTLPDLTPKTLTVSKSKLSVKVGKTVKIKATAKPSAKITYTSSNKKVATVNSKGVVTGKKAGTATITVKANGKTVKVKVTVKKK